MKTETDHPFAAWQQRCATGGLTVTPARAGLLRALLEQRGASDAVALLQAAQRHYPEARIATVYRFLRELELRGWIDVHAQAHGRSRWSLRSLAQSNTEPNKSDVHQMVAQVGDFLRMLEQVGLAEKHAGQSTPLAGDARTIAILREIAGYLGYRLLPNLHYPAY